MTASTLDRRLGEIEGAHYFGRLVLVECDGVRHLAKQDRSGKWRTISRQKEFERFIVVVKMAR